MENAKPKKTFPKVLLILLLLLLLLGGIAAFLYFTQPDLFLTFKKPPTPYTVTSNIQAFTLAPPAENSTEKEMTEYFQQAVDYAKENDFNTLVFDGKKDLTVYWRDGIFPPATDIASQDTLFSKTDPLAILCKIANQQDIQVFLAFNPYTSGGYSSEMKQKAVKLATEQGGTNHSQFSAADTAYATLLIQSLQKLPHKYPLAGIVLQDLPPASTPQNPEATLLYQIADKTKAYWNEKGLTTSFALQFEDQNSFVTPEVVKTLADKQNLQYVLPQIAPNAKVFSRLEAYSASAPLIVSHFAENDDIVFFTASKMNGLQGAILGDYRSLQQTPATVALLRSTFTSEESTLPVGFTVPQTLSINYPSDGAKVYTDQVFIMGTSDPAKPLAVNGTDVSVRAPEGVFGIAMDITEGDNVFTFTQDGISATITITKPAYSSGPTISEYPHDSSVEAEEGQAIEITNIFSSALQDYGNDAAMNETFYTGAVAVIQDSIETTRYNPNSAQIEKTWVYRITSGDYIYSNQGKLIEDGTSAFTALSAEEHPYGEMIHFTGKGTPAAYLACENGILKVTMYDTSFTLPEGFTSTYVKSAKVNPIENGVELLLEVPEIGGYSIEYENGQTRLFLKRTPKLSNNPLRPLEGVRVMLDPGHGGKDAGALGVMGASHGPNEKDLNFALGQITAYRLRQLGAEVLMTRTEDVFVPTMELLQMEMEQKPDFYISLHHNSMELNADRNGVEGVQSYFFIPPEYTAPASGQFAQNLISNIGPATGRPGDTASWGYYNVLRTPVCPSVLFEYGFIISPKEFEDISSTDGMYAAACATANAVLQSVENQ